MAIQVKFLEGDIVRIHCDMAETVNSILWHYNISKTVFDINVTYIESPHPQTYRLSRQQAKPHKLRYITAFFV